MVRAVYEEEIKSGMVKVMRIPDIEQVCIGRGVGYSIVEVGKDIERISATDIRAGKSFDVPQVVQRIMDISDELNKGNIKPLDVYLDERAERER